jgi:sulfur carrier protein ThiS
MKLYAGGYLTFYMPQRITSMDIPLKSPQTVKDLLSELQIPLEEVHLVAINGDLADLDTTILHDTDVVRIFSSVNGG